MAQIGEVRHRLPLRHHVNTLKVPFEYMTQIVLDFDADAMSAIRQGPEQLATEVKTAAVIQWYAEGRISQSKAAEILGLSRSRLLDELYRRRVPAVQTDIAELREELACFAG